MLKVWFKDNDSEALSLHVNDLGRRQRAQEQINTYQVPYSDYEPTEHTGKYLPYIRPMDFAWKDKTKTSAIYKWLTGYGKLRTSKDPRGYFKAHVISGYEVDRFSKNYDRMMVQFKINPPFFYLNSGDTPLPFTASPAVINNPGTHNAEPLIKVTGSGNINLDINGKIIQLTGVVDHIYLDSESQYVYKGTTNEGQKMVGDFPVLNPGVNNMTWTGTVTEIEIIPRWRDL